MNNVVTLRGPDGPVEVTGQPMPEVAADQLLVRVELGGVCATDLHIYQGHIPGFEYPATLGHELVGTIEKGSGTDPAGRPLKPGARVAVMPATPCGVCPACRRSGPIPDCENFDVIGFSNPDKRPAGGGWGQYVLCNSGRARVFVTDAPAEAAVLAEPAATPMEGMRRAGFAYGDTVLVQGTGTIGLLAIATAKALGASRIVAIGGPERRLGIAEELGAAVTIDIADGGDRVARALEANGGGFDAVIECAGVPATIPEGLSCLRKGGVYIELGHFSDVGDVAINPYRHLLSRDATLVAVSGYTPDSFRRALRVVEGLGDKVGRLVTHRVPMSRAEDAMLALTAERNYRLDGTEVGKIVIDPWA